MDTFEIDFKKYGYNRERALSLAQVGLAAVKDLPDSVQARTFIETLFEHGFSQLGKLFDSEDQDSLKRETLQLAIEAVKIIGRVDGIKNPRYIINRFLRAVANTKAGVKDSERRLRKKYNPDGSETPVVEYPPLLSGLKQDLFPVTEETDEDFELKIRELFIRLADQYKRYAILQSRIKALKATPEAQESADILTMETDRTREFITSQFQIMAEYMGKLPNKKFDEVYKLVEETFNIDTQARDTSKVLCERIYMALTNSMLLHKIEKDKAAAAIDRERVTTHHEVKRV